MEITEEENFPRGGKRHLSVKRPKEDDNLFVRTAHPKPKKARKEKKNLNNTVNEETFHSSLRIQGTLTYNTVRTDMIILGCIRNVTNFSLEIELPGLIFGYVNITNISDPFTKYLNSKLEQSDEDSDTLLTTTFKIGQLVLTKVISLESREKGIHIECSLNPREIYNGKSHSSFETGALLWGSVQSELEHGYEINVGIKNCRVFLPSKNVDSDKNLVIGELLWCVVNKSDSSNAASTLTVTSRTEYIKKAKIEEINNLYELMPGMQLDMIVEKITSNGIRGKFLNEFYGYVDEGQLKKDINKYEEGTLLTVIVLYVDHTVKVTYFTTFDFDLVPPPQYKIGDIVIAEVTSKAPNGIYLKLPSKAKCIVTNKRLINTLKKNLDNLDISETIRLKYAPKSRHSLRILDYNHLSRLYIGTLEQFLVKETFFSKEDVTAGQLLNVVVKEIKTEGLVVSVGHIRGFVPNLYLSNAKYSEAAKKKFREGQRVKARVLTVEANNILLTLKSDQIDSELCITNLDQAQRGDCCTGVVIHTNPKGALVVFYDNIKGWISKKYLIDQNSDETPDPELFFFIGQVVNPWILGVKNDKIILSLLPPKVVENVPNLTVAVGQRINGVVSSVRKDRIHVKTARGKPIGIVPLNHISSNLFLCPMMIKTFKIGDELKDIICINNSDDQNVLSRREALAFRRYPKLKLKKFTNLKPGNIVRCSYLSECDLGIYVIPFILDYTEKILIRKKDIVNKGTIIPKFETHQSIVTRIEKIDHERKKIRLTAKLSEVFDNSVESVCSLFSEYLTDYQTTRNFGREHNWNICEYESGDRLECQVEKLGDHGGCLVKLPNGANGLVAPLLCPDKLKEKQTITGVFLSPNLTGNYAEICLKPDICQKINTIQNGTITYSKLSSCLAEIILFRADSGTALLKHKNGNRQLINIPLFVHENDFVTSKRYYQDKLKLCICGKVGNSLIGISKKSFVTLDKNREKFTLEKILRLEKKPEITSLKQPVSVQKQKPLESVKENKRVNKSSAKEIQEVDDEKEDQETIEEMELSEDDDEEQLSDDKDQLSDDEDQLSEENQLSDEDQLSDDEDQLSDNEEEVNNHKDEQQFSDEEIQENGDEDSEETSDEEAGEATNKEESSDEETSEDEETVTKKSKRNKINSKGGPVVSGVNSFFNISQNGVQNDSSDEDLPETSAKKKKKLSSAERARQAREEEERISKIEKELADSTRAPESAEQFDRLLLANPNSSELWTKYIAFHTAATEFDKARAVAKKALDTINMTLNDERFNIWMALLNLENMLGTKESFEKTFEDAVKYNDSLQVYLKVIQMLAESGKLDEMEEKIKKVRNKHKQFPQMWLEIAKTYYQLGQFKNARNMKDAALKSIDHKKTQLEIIVKFAIMEFKFGDANQGAAIFETIISSDPRKVTIWTTYVDQLIKKNDIGQARQVLERSVCQRLPLKSMKSLFMKFRMFEEQHGTPQSVEAVKEKAKEYVSKYSAE